MQNISFHKLPEHLQSMINDIKDTRLKNIYNQFVFLLFSSFLIDNANITKIKIKAFLLNFLSEFKFIAFKLSNKCIKNQNYSIIHSKNQKINFSIETIICVEKKCLIIEGIENDAMLEILNKTNSKLINVQNFSEIEKNNYILYFMKNKDFVNNCFVKNTLLPISFFLIHRFFCPTSYFKDNSFFCFRKDKKMTDQIFKEKFKQLLKSKSIDEIENDDIIEIFKGEDNESQNEIEDFLEEDFIKLHQIYSKSDSIYYIVFHLESLYIFLMKKYCDIKLSKYQSRELEFYLKHPPKCFTKFYGYVKNKKSEKIGSLFEYLCNGNLKNFINQYKNRITPIFSFMVMIRVFQAIKYLNMNNMVHRDLKPENILLNHDFVPFISDNETIRKIEENQNFTINLGCLAYMSPEQYYGNLLSCQSDIYSFGLIIYFLFEHKNLIKSYEQHKNNNKPKISNCTENIQDIFDSCIEVDLNKRIKFKELENLIYDEIINSNHFQLYFKKENCNEIIDFEITEYLYENITILNQQKSLYILKKYFYNMYYSISKELAEIDEYKSDALNNLGNLFYCGIVVMKNYLEAKKYYELASQLNNSVSLNSLGDMFKRGIGVKQDYTKAKYYYELAAEKENSESLYNLGYLYYNGYGVTKSITKAKSYFERSSKLNNTHGLNALGYMHIAGIGIKPDFSKAIKCYEKALKLNNLNSYLNLAYLYVEGLGVTRDYEKAVKYYKDAAEKNHKRAIHHLGIMYKKGLGVELNLNKARELFERAANLGNIDAFHSLGNIYLHGKGVNVDYDKARTYYLIGARYSNHSSLYKLGIIYENGLGVKKDYLKAKEYYEKAAEEGYYSAFINLANFYINGEYFKVDEEKAISYYLKNINTNGEKIFYENNGFYRTRKNFGYYPSHNDIGLIYLFRKEYDKAIEYLKKSSFSEYQLGLNNYALLFDPSIEKNKKHFDHDFFNKYSKYENYKKAYEIYKKAADMNFSLAEFNLAHMLEEKGDKSNAIRYYKLASKHEHFPLIFHNKERHDKRLNFSISFTILYTDCKLFLEFLDSDLEKSKKYFIKIISKIQNENEINSFNYIKDLFLELPFLNEQFMPNECIVTNDDLSFKKCNLNSHVIKKKIIEIKINKHECINRKKERKFTKEDPNQIFLNVVDNKSNMSLFIHKIKEVVSLMKSIIYTPPYHIIFGRFVINNPCSRIKENSQIQDINQSFYEGFGLPI